MYTKQVTSDPAIQIIVNRKNTAHQNYGNQF